MKFWIWIWNDLHIPFTQEDLTVFFVYMQHFLIDDKRFSIKHFGISVFLKMFYLFNLDLAHVQTKFADFVTLCVPVLSTRFVLVTNAGALSLRVSRDLMFLCSAVVQTDGLLLTQTRGPTLIKRKRNIVLSFF